MSTSTIRGRIGRLPSPFLTGDEDPMPVRLEDVRRRDVLGGMILEYYGVAA